MAYTPIVGTDPISPIENLINPRFVQAYTDFGVIATDRAIKTYKWANTAARNAQAGMTEGDVGDQADSNQRFRYSGSAWVDITSGLIPIVPTSVAGTGVTLSATGRVTASVAASISMNGIFTSAFDNYLVIPTFTAASAAADVFARLRLAGTDASGANYSTLLSDVSSTGTVPSTLNGTNTSSFAGRVEATGAAQKLEFNLPASAHGTYQTFESRDSGVWRRGSTFHTLTTAYDGLTIYTAGATLTGTVRIYGYNAL